jgi:hypothetical protein
MALEMENVSSGYPKFVRFASMAKPSREVTVMLTLGCDPNAITDELEGHLQCRIEYFVDPSTGESVKLDI